MTERLAQRTLFDWFGRPYVDLRERLLGLRLAINDQFEALQRLLAEREVLLGGRSTTNGPPPGGEPTTGAEPRQNTRQLDLRVRSVLVRDGSASPIRQELADLVSQLAEHRQLDAVAPRAYEVVAAAESLLALMRGDGWVFSHLDVLAPGPEADEAVHGYRRDLEQARSEFSARADRLALEIGRQQRRYGVARYGLLLLLFLGPLIGLWSGLQLGYGRSAPEPPKILVPDAVVRALQTLSRNERLVEIGSSISGVPWTEDSPAEQVAQLGRDVEADLLWSTMLCERLMPLLAAREDGRRVLLPQCSETLVRIGEARRSLAALGDLLHEQDTLRARLLHEVQGTIPAMKLPSPPPQPGTPLASPLPPTPNPAAEGAMPPAAAGSQP